MNIHPLFVHFPVALLSLYAVIRIVPVHKIFPSVNWKPTERILLICGVIGAFVSLQTGEMAEHLVRPPHDLVGAHETFAQVTTWSFAIVLLGEIALMVEENGMLRSVASFVKVIKDICAHKVVSLVLTIVGLCALVATGVLGGVLVYGTTADPFAQPLLDLLGITL